MNFCINFAFQINGVNNQLWFLMPIIFFLARRTADKPFKLLTPNYYHFIIE